MFDYAIAQSFGRACNVYRVFGTNTPRSDITVDDIKSIMDVMINNVWSPDLSWRTHKGIGEYKDCSEKAREMLKTELAAYFSGAAPACPADFDEWHKKTCDKFIACYERWNAVKTPKVSYGKAQKAVNMLFKYVLTGIAVYYSTPQTQGYPMREYFRYCHFPLDSYNLNDFYYAVVPNAKLATIGSWSFLSSYDDYMAVQNNIRDIFKTGAPISYTSTRVPSNSAKSFPAGHFASDFPLEAEFEIW